MRHRAIVRTLYFFLVMIGGLSLRRFGPQFEALGMVAEIRYWLAAALVLTVAAWICVGKRIPSDWMLWAWLASVIGLHAYVLLSMSWAGVPPPDAVRSAPDIVLLLFTLAVALVIFGTSPEAGVAWLLRAFLWISMLLVIVGVLVRGRLVGEVSEIGAGGIGMARVHAVAVLAAVYCWRRMGKHWWLFAIPVSMAGLLLTGSRAAALGLSVALCAFGATHLRLPGRREMVGGLLLASAGWVLYGLLPDVRYSVEYFWHTLWVGGGTRIGMDTLYLADRDTLFADAWDVFLADPFTGVGHGAYVSGLEGSPYPHNLILNIAVETGLGGLIIYSFSCLLLLARLLRPTSPEHLFAALAGICFLVIALFTGTYYDARLMWLFFLLYMCPVTVRRPVGARRPLERGAEPMRLQPIACGPV